MKQGDGGSLEVSNELVDNGVFKDQQRTWDPPPIYFPRSYRYVSLGHPLNTGLYLGRETCVKTSLLYRHLSPSDDHACSILYRPYVCR